MPSRPSSRKRRPARAIGSPRRRRSAADAKRAILDAAEARFAARGPEGIRLQEIAADVGVSHPAILHHFGTREDLMRAVIERALGALREEVLAALTTSEPSQIDVARLIERVFEILGARGQVRLMAWLAVAGEDRRGRHEGMTFFVREIAELTHRERLARYAEAGRRPPPFEDSLFAILLATVALLGDALLGDAARASSGLDDAAAGRRFREWFAQLLVAYLDGQTPPPRRPRRR